MARIFIIEHDPDFADCLQRILTADGYDVTCAVNVSEAIENIRESKPNLTIVDIHDGLNLSLEDIEKLTAFDDSIPVLVTTVKKTAELALKALGAGASDYLLKPFSSNEILQRVHSLTGIGETEFKSNTINQISDSLRILNSIDDILKINLDRLATTLHFTDCLIALKDEDNYRVQASRGYTPDPHSKSIIIPADITGSLESSTIDPVNAWTDLIDDVTSGLEIEGSSPFAALIPLIIGSDENSELLGFVIGHSANLIEKHDLLDMERFLAASINEISSLLHNSGMIDTEPDYLYEGEFLIPETSRDEAINKILCTITPLMCQKKDTFWIRLVLDEAINNAILHGHIESLTSPVTNLRLKYQIKKDQIVLTIEDAGNGFDYSIVPDPTTDENLLNISGRGIYLMRKIMDSVKFNEIGNIITLVKQIDGDSLKPF